jgi:hypothetical protein
MSYYVVKTSFESGEVNKNGDPVYKKAEFLVSGQSVLDVETKMAEYLDGSVGGFETTQVTKSKIEAVIGN